MISKCQDKSFLLILIFSECVNWQNKFCSILPLSHGGAAGWLACRSLGTKWQFQYWVKVVARQCDRQQIEVGCELRRRLRCVVYETGYCDCQRRIKFFCRSPELQHRKRTVRLLFGLNLYYLWPSSRFQFSFVGYRDRPALCSMPNEFKYNKINGPLIKELHSDSHTNRFWGIFQWDRGIWKISQPAAGFVRRDCRV